MTIEFPPPKLDRTGTILMGGRPVVLVVILACMLAFHLREPAATAPMVRPAVASRADIVGKARVIDGDTVDISGTRIRLLGIDAPESAQNCTDRNRRSWPCGRAATREIKDLIAGQPLACESAGLDRYRRVLAVCALPDGTDVNAWMVREGWALAYGYSMPYAAEEADAHAARRGIWSGTFIAPWEWRHRHLQ